MVLLLSNMKADHNVMVGTPSVQFDLAPPPLHVAVLGNSLAQMTALPLEAELPHDQYSAFLAILNGANELTFSGSTGMHVDEGEPVTNNSNSKEVLNVSASATNVQRPFSLAQETYDITSNAPLLLKCPKGSLLRLGFASCDLGSATWQLLPSTDLVPQLPANFAGTFGGIYTGGGLVLMEKFAKQEYHLVVSNPTNRSQRQLPPMMDFSKPEILGIFVDPTTMSYKIPVVQRKFNEQEMDLVIMQEYDSILNSWEFAGQWRNRFHVEPIGAAYVDGTLFFLTYDRQAFVDGQQQRVHHIYYLNDIVWQRLELPLGLGFFGYPFIFEHAGRLMLGGGLHGYDDQENVEISPKGVHSLCVWEHDWVLMKWMDVCTMPDSWVEELYRCPPEERRCTFEITAGGNFVCVASSNGRVAKCDITQNEWAWIPKCDLAKYADGDRILILERRPDISV